MKLTNDELLLIRELIERNILHNSTYIKAYEKYEDGSELYDLERELVERYQMAVDISIRIDTLVDED